MKNKIIICLLFILNLSFSIESVTFKKNKVFVAITGFQYEGIDSTTANILTDRIRTELFKTKVFNVIERSQMKAILEEQEFQQTDCVSDECLIEAGQLLGVTHLITGTVGRLKRTITIDIRMIDVETGGIEYTGSTDCSKCGDPQLLLAKSKIIANKLKAHVKETRKKRNTEQKSFFKDKWPYIGVATLITGVVVTLVLTNEPETKTVERSSGSITVQ